MKVVTLLFLLKDDQVLLAMKKRGFGMGKWNGVGGKVDRGETIEQATIRECQEEIGVTPRQLKKLGHLEFYEHTDPSFFHDCHIFVARLWHGEPTETEEMRPQWFNQNAIPYAKMWADDRLWLPHVLAGINFEGAVVLDGSKIHHSKIQKIGS